MVFRHETETDSRQTGPSPGPGHLAPRYFAAFGAHGRGSQRFGGKRGKLKAPGKKQSNPLTKWVASKERQVR